MKYIILDLEWNQPSYKGMTIYKPIPFYGEIIQIGAVKVDENLNIISTYNRFIQPRYYKEMHNKVKRLTGITEEQLGFAMPFFNIFGSFKDWCGTDFQFITWGPDDMKILKDNLIMNGFSSKWIPQNRDLQRLFDKKITKQKRQISLTYAMEYFGIQPLKAHDALNDALNTRAVAEGMKNRAYKVNVAS